LDESKDKLTNKMALCLDDRIKNRGLKVNP